MKCAPFLALRVLRRLAEYDGNRFPLAVLILRKQIYVDDVLFGDHDVTALRLKRDQLISLLNCGKFKLRKWASNSAVLLEDIDPHDHGLACDKNLSNDETVKILGIVWNPISDDFCYRVSLDPPISFSKRSILYVIARLYDPLGWATPVIITAKIFMQNLWRIQIDWDTPLLPHFVNSWTPDYSNFQALNNVHISRWTSFEPSSCIELHGFADASSLAYAAAVYARVVLTDGETRVTLLAGKSKVAPIKPLTIPRLELLAALLLSRLMNFVKSTLNLINVPCFCCPFLDSDEILRVGGRLRHAPLPYDSKHPILLAAHPLVRLIVRQFHFRSLYGGLQLTLRTLRQQFWILRARSLVKNEIHQCVVCVRERAEASTQLMGNLPMTRVTPPPREFSWCGLDYAGPVRVRASAGRGISTKKAYIALFICLSTRAVHLELVGDYSTPAFIGVFTHFCSCRGLPQSVFSDNGTNFIGADKELTAAYRATLRDPNFLNQTASDKISWQFIPPAAPHVGGI
ncbi:uncharacterized protein [Cardiocondyla obscurior]|uniref:uncharacterized protein n=1 Tax=Cardiocondyla obscurior TaxID=286306 RepID=UPI0039656536